MKISNRENWTAIANGWNGDPTRVGLRDPGPVRRNQHPEQNVLNAVMAALRLHPKVAWVARVNSGAYKTPDGRFIRFGFPGCPDILGQMKDGRILMIECKSEVGRATEEQQAVITRVIANNGVAGVVRSVEDALRIIES